MRLVIKGAPRTKKNHGKRIKRGNRIFHVQSDAAQAWESKAVDQLGRQTAHLPKWLHKPTKKRPVPNPPTFCLNAPVSVCAHVYRDADRGDLVGYLQAIGDALERGGVLQNDAQIKSWDGSRLFIDRTWPRVEITIEPMEPMAR